MLSLCNWPSGALPLGFRSTDLFGRLVNEDKEQ
jgi:hypothetical protein